MDLCGGDVGEQKLVEVRSRYNKRVVSTNALIRFKLETVDLLEGLLKDLQAEAHSRDVLELGEQADLFQESKDVGHQPRGRAERADGGALLKDLVVNALSF